MASQKTKEKKLRGKVDQVSGNWKLGIEIVVKTIVEIL